MRIAELIRRDGAAFSFEFFPPKTPAGEANLFKTIDQLRSLRPDFVSVTYGAGGTTREKTIDLVCRIKNELGIEAMAHLTCVGSDRQEIHGVLSRLRQGGIENVLALRGDPPRDQTHFIRPENGFGYANELVGFIRHSGFDFSVGGAAYPEGHVECPDRQKDIENLRRKVDAGLDFLITQLFFDNQDYFRFLDQCRHAGIEIPLLPGIMPITDSAQIQRFATMCGASIPTELRARLEAAGDDRETVQQIGIDHAYAQCVELLERGVPGIHFYTLNQSPSTRAIVERLRR